MMSHVGLYVLTEHTVTLYYQYYINRKGLPLSSDFIVYQSRYGRENSLMWSYYYQ